MPIRSIRARLTLWYTTLLAFTFLLLGGVAYGLLVHNLSHDLDTALSGVAQALAERTHGGASPFFPPDVEEAFRRFFGFSPFDPYFGMLDPRGQEDPRLSQQFKKLPLSRQALKNALEGLSTFETDKGLARYPVRLLTMPVIEGGRVVNLIQVGMSMESSYLTRRRFLLTMAAVFPVALLLAGGGGWLLARRVLQPVDRMTETAQRILGAEHLAERLEYRGADDELGRLGQNLQ